MISNLLILQEMVKTFLNFAYVVKFLLIWSHCRVQETEKLLSLEISIFLSQKCDQISRLFAPYLPIYNNDNLPIQRKMLSKQVQKYCQVLNIPSKSCQSLFKCYQSGKFSPSLVILFLSVCVCVCVRERERVEGCSLFIYAQPLVQPFMHE